MKHVATILHLTDLHLFVDRQGVSRSTSTRRVVQALVEMVRDGTGQGDQRHALTRLIASLPIAGRGVHTAPDNAWRALQVTVQQYLESEQVPVLVAQTGDVEAFGSGWLDDEAPYPGFAALGHLKKFLRSTDAVDRWLDIYGNHDLWFGALPITPVSMDGHLDNALRVIRRVDGLSGPWPGWATPWAQIETPDLAVAALRLNTVYPSRFPAVVANGRLLPHPPGDSKGRAATGKALQQLRQSTAALPLPSGPCLRIALAHHPPFRVRRNLTTGLLWGRSRLKRALGDAGVHLVLAGHLHTVHPKSAGADEVRTVETPIQLVGDSATVHQNAGKRRLSVYRIYCDGTRTVEIRRSIAEQRGPLAPSLKEYDSPDLRVRFDL